MTRTDNNATIVAREREYIMHHYNKAVGAVSGQNDVYFKGIDEHTIGLLLYIT